MPLPARNGPFVRLAESARALPLTNFLAVRDRRTHALRAGRKKVSFIDPMSSRRALMAGEMYLVLSLILRLISRNDSRLERSKAFSLIGALYVTRVGGSFGSVMDDGLGCVPSRRARAADNLATSDATTWLVGI